MDWIIDKLRQQQQAGLLRRQRSVTALPGGGCLVDGRSLRNFASNDYLDLAHDPRVLAAAQQALAAHGLGSGASPLVSGRSPCHAELEQQLARFEQQPAAVLFPSGYAANLGVIASLAEAGDTVYCDRWNHASLVDGCRLCGARLRVFRHTDLDTLHRELRKTSSTGRRLIVIDSVFSMDADFAPLPELCDLAERYDALLIVDEAHGTGVFGAAGRGVAELQQVEHRIAVRIGTLSKALGALGGFVSGSAELIQWIWNRARTQMFSTALPPAVCAGATAALRIVESEPHRRQNLLRSADHLRERLQAAGIAPLPGSQGPIVPVVVRSPERAVALAGALELRGYFVAAIRPPTVPQGTSRLRITLTAAHTPEDFAGLVNALAEVW